jgi:hypothetical protein
VFGGAHFSNSSSPVSASYMSTTPYALLGLHCGPTLGPQADSLSPQDAWIAATAIGLDAPLTTNNRSAFEHVQKLRLLTV